MKWKNTKITKHPKAINLRDYGFHNVTTLISLNILKQFEVPNLRNILNEFLII